MLSVALGGFRLYKSRRVYYSGKEQTRLFVSTFADDTMPSFDLLRPSRSLQLFPSLFETKPSSSPAFRPTA